MLFRSLGIKPPLGVYLRTIDSETVVYRGQNTFEAFCTFYIYMSNVKQGRACSMYLPMTCNDMRNFIIDQGGIISDTPSEALVEIFNDDDISTKLFPYRPSDNTPMFGYRYKPTSESVAIVLRRDFMPPKSWNDTISRLQVPIEQFSWTELAANKFKAVITTDWKHHFCMHILGVPSFLIAGPSWPHNLYKSFGVPRNTYLVIDDKTKVRACPCPNPKMCHDITSETKPCWKSALLDRPISHFLRQISK